MWVRASQALQVDTSAPVWLEVRSIRFCHKLRSRLRSKSRHPIGRRALQFIVLTPTAIDQRSWPSKHVDSQILQDSSRSTILLRVHDTESSWPPRAGTHTGERTRLLEAYDSARRHRIEHRPSNVEHPWNLARLEHGGGETHTCQNVMPAEPSMFKFGRLVMGRTRVRCTRPRPKVTTSSMESRPSNIGGKDVDGA